jgi:PAS domain S-box-containing protein
MLLTEKGFFDCNQRTLELFGYKNKDEFFKVHPADISPPTQPNGQDSFSLSMERIKTAYNEGVNSFEWVHCSRDGTVFPANVLLTAFEYGGKRVLQATVRDLSESKKMEEVRRLAQLGELVSSIAHEVNNPLMIISGNAQLCQMEDLKNDSVKENLKMIVDQCERAKSIIHRMLVFSRPGKGQIKEMDINENLEFVTELVEHQYSLANVRIIRDFSASLPKVRADEKQMQEVFLNLIRNAAEAMPDGGTLTLTTALEDGFVRLEFIDTGAGMSGEVMDKIFYPFFSTKELGVGLGLSVSQSIIKIHGGEIKFKSKPGEGTVATVLLPIT